MNEINHEEKVYKMIPVYQPDLSGNEKKYLIECIESNWISSKGKFVHLFEEKFKEYIGIRFATTVSNGTVAIHLALVALGIEQGDEVIVPTLTYVASVNPIVQVGGKPVFVDSLEESWQMDPEDVRKKITPKTKAIIIVHLYGQSAEIDTLMEIAREYNLLVIEDCAEAFGTLYKGKHVGTFGDIATFSFYGNKTITCGEGGMVITKDERIYKRLIKLKNQGVSKEREYWHDVIGYNYRMTNMQAAIGLAQIERANEFINRKREIAELYKKYLADVPVIVHKEQPNTFHSYWMVSILVERPEDKETLRSYLKEKGIETRPLFYPVHLMPMYATGERLAVAENLSSRGINLPSWPRLSNEQVEFICKRIKEYFMERL